MHKYSLNRSLLLKAIALGLFALLACVNPSISVAQANDGPIAKITVTGDGQTQVGVPIQLYGSADDPENDPIEMWTWDVVDGPVGADWAFLEGAHSQNTRFWAATAGTYSIVLETSDEFGGGPRDYAQIVVTENQPPVAKITASTIEGYAPLTVDFSAADSFDPEGLPLFYDWNFDTARPYSSEMTASATFVYPRTYTITLGINDPEGLLGTASIDIIVHPAPNTPPAVTLSAAPVTGPAPLEIAFNASATDDDGDTLTYSWDFGDGQFGTNESTQSHTYASEGTYLAQVTVSDGTAATTQSTSIVVAPAPMLEVTRLTIRKSDSRKQPGGINLSAIVSAFELTPDTNISVSVDGVSLFSAPFGEFRIANHDDFEYDESDDDVEHAATTDHPVTTRYKYRSGKTRATFDTTTGRLTVVREKLPLAGLTPNDGLTVEIMFDDRLYLQVVEAKQTRHHWHFKDHD